MKSHITKSIIHKSTYAQTCTIVYKNWIVQGNVVVQDMAYDQLLVPIVSPVVVSEMPTVQDIRNSRLTKHNNSPSIAELTGHSGDKYPVDKRR